MDDPRNLSILSLNLEPRAEAPDFRAPPLLPPGRPVTVVNAERDGVPLSAASFSHLILSGSTHSILDDHATTGPALALVCDAVDRGRPVMGVCYGHQLIARALLGPAHVRRAPQPEFGWLPIRWNERGVPWFQGLPNPFRAFVGHFDEVVDLPADWQVLASSDHCPIHAYLNPQLKVFGVQFHPEMDLATGNACFRLDAPALMTAGANLAHILAEAVDDGSGPVLFSRFLSWHWDS